MELVTSQQMAKGAAERWKSIYCVDGKWPYRSDAEDTYKRLVALGESPDPDAVGSVAGKGFARVFCDNCNSFVGEAVGFRSVCTGHKVFICRDCVEQMIGLFADGEGEA